jgi:hypothetical protein
MTKTDAIHEIYMTSLRFLGEEDDVEDENESYWIGTELSDIAEALATDDLRRLQHAMESADTMSRDCIPDEAFEVIFELGGCDLSPTHYGR